MPLWLWHSTAHSETLQKCKGKPWSTWTQRSTPHETTQIRDWKKHNSRGTSFRLLQSVQASVGALHCRRLDWEDGKQAKHVFQNRNMYCAKMVLKISNQNLNCSWKVGLIKIDAFENACFQFWPEHRVNWSLLIQKSRKVLRTFPCILRIYISVRLSRSPLSAANTVRKEKNRKQTSYPSQ